MQVIEANDKCIEAMIVLAKRTYEQECNHLKELKTDDFSDILRDLITEAVKNNGGAVCLDKGKLLGYFLYNSTWTDGDIVNYSFPIWGYAAVGEKKEQILSRMYEFMADRLCQTQTVRFSVNIYAHDSIALWLFSCLQFGVQCCEVIRDTMDPICEGGSVDVRELDKAQIIEQWPSIWSMLGDLAQHLRKSPTFYPAREFTEDHYKVYLNNETTRVFAVYEEENIVGILTASPEAEQFFISAEGNYEVGNIYVLETHRGQNIAQELLQSVNDTMLLEGTWRLTVQHVTANPNAREFWDRYFKPYMYTMIRDVKRPQ